MRRRRPELTYARAVEEAYFRHVNARITEEQRQLIADGRGEWVRDPTRCIYRHEPTGQVVTELQLREWDLMVSGQWTVNVDPEGWIPLDDEG